MKDDWHRPEEMEMAGVSEGFFFFFGRRPRRWLFRETMTVSNWILSSCQPHRVTSEQDDDSDNKESCEGDDDSDNEESYTGEWDMDWKFRRLRRWQIRRMS